MCLLGALLGQLPPGKARGKRNCSHLLSLELLFAGSEGNSLCLGLKADRKEAQENYYWTEEGSFSQRRQRSKRVFPGC